MNPMSMEHSNKVYPIMIKLRELTGRRKGMLIVVGGTLLVMATCHRSGASLSLEKMQLAAEKGDREAQAQLGKYYLDVDYDAARQWLQKAAESGHSEAQVQLGLMYVEGRGLPKDPATATAWFKKAADQGNLTGTVKLGKMYQRGLTGGHPDEVEAVRLYRKAAGQGHAEGQWILGAVIAEGRGGMKPDDKEAARWYRKAAEQGFANAQINLAKLYLDGTGVDQDATKAFAWYQKAAKDGSALAQVSLGRLYMTGQGVETNLVEAVAWIRRAAEQGFGEGQFLLATMYYEGIGLPRDEAKAKLWLERAALSHFKDVPEFIQLAVASRYPQDNPKYQLLSMNWPSIKVADVRAALRHGADVNAAYDGVVPLMLAAEHTQNPEVIKFMIDNGALVNATNEDGKTALFYAAMSNTKPVIACLLDHNAEVNVCDQAGQTPLMGAASLNDDPAVINLLLKHGADVQATNHLGYSALFLVGTPEVAQILIGKELNVNARSSRGTTPLIAAALRGRPDVMRVMLDHGAKVSLRDEQGNSAKYYLVHSTQHQDLINELEKRELEEFETKGSERNTMIADIFKQLSVATPVASNKFTVYQQGAEKNFPKSQYSLGLCYAIGIGTEQNEAKAQKWFGKSAAQGHRPAQWMMVQCCLLGVGMKKDPQQAMPWLERLAAAGDVTAQITLATCYANGEHVKKNAQKAAQWLAKARETCLLAMKQGDGQARETLALIDEIAAGTEEGEQPAPTGITGERPPAVDRYVMGDRDPQVVAQVEAWIQEVPAQRAIREKFVLECAATFAGMRDSATTQAQQNLEAWRVQNRVFRGTPTPEERRQLMEWAGWAGHWDSQHAYMRDTYGEAAADNYKDLNPRPEW